MVLAVNELFSQGICSPAKNVGLGICSHGIDSLPFLPPEYNTNPFTEEESINGIKWQFHCFVCNRLLQASGFEKPQANSFQCKIYSMSACLLRLLFRHASTRYSCFALLSLLSVLKTCFMDGPSCWDGALIFLPPEHNKNPYTEEDST